MKQASPARWLRYALLCFYRRHPAMAHRPTKFKVFVSLLLLFSLGVLCSAMLAA